MILPLKSLLDIANKIWQANLQIVTMVTEIQKSSVSPDLRFTWVQEPVRFEDAFGRIFPIPSEYSWAKVEAIICAQFSELLAYKKVSSREYELFNSMNSSQCLGQATGELRPGLSITMAMVVGHYGPVSFHCCPRSDCRYSNTRKVKAGGIEW